MSPETQSPATGLVRGDAETTGNGAVSLSILPDPASFDAALTVAELRLLIGFIDVIQARQARVGRHHQVVPQ